MNRHKAQLDQGNDDIDKQGALLEEHREELVEMRKEEINRQRDVKYREI